MSRPSLRQQISLALANFGARDVRALKVSHVVDEHIRRVLEACDDNQSLASRLLGVDRNTIARKLGRRRSAKPRKRARKRPR